MGDVVFWIAAIGLGFGVAYALWPVFDDEDQKQDPAPHDSDVYLRQGWPADQEDQQGAGAPSAEPAADHETREGSARR
jgi:hypothetical protein